MAGLSQSVLFERAYRPPLFLEKYKRGDNFELTDGRKVKLEFDQKIYDVVLKLIKETNNNGTPSKGVLQNYRLTIKSRKKEKETIPFGKLLKSEEFGGGMAAKAQLYATAVNEAAQAVYAQALFDSNGSNDAFLPDKIKQAHTRAETPTPITAIANIDIKWLVSNTSIAKLLWNTFGKNHSSKKYVFHSGSKFIKNLQNHFKKLNRQEKNSIIEHHNKWSAADIYMLSSKSNTYKLFETKTVHDLNTLLFEALSNQDIIPISLKKSCEKPKITYYNFNGPRKTYKFYQYSTNINRFFESKDITITASCNKGTSVIIKFNSSPSYRGEIQGRFSKHGSLGGNAINMFLNEAGQNNLLDQRVYDFKGIQVLFNKNNRLHKSTMERFYHLYLKHPCKIGNKKMSFDEFYKNIMSKNAEWFASKYMGLDLIDKILNINNTNTRNRLVENMIYYASSNLDMSAPFIKISSD